MSSRNRRLGSARVSRAGDGVSAIADFCAVWRPGLAQPTSKFRAKEKFVAARHSDQHARRVLYPTEIPYRVL